MYISLVPSLCLCPFNGTLTAALCYMRRNEAMATAAAGVAAGSAATGEAVGKRRRGGGGITGVLR